MRELVKYGFFQSLIGLQERRTSQIISVSKILEAVFSANCYHYKAKSSSDRLPYGHLSEL